jgi:FMN phosphatase YigB (HAD superfamily)
MASAEKLKVKHLLVDLDGTLLANRAMPLTFSFFGESINLFKKFGRINALRALRAVYEEFDKADPKLKNSVRFIRVFAKRLKITEDEARKRWVDGILRLFPEMEKYFKPVKGAKDFLEWAKGKYTLTLATNPVWPREIIELRLKWAGVDPAVFDWISDWDQMNAVKPLPEYYRGILSARGFEAEDCLMIGDSEKKDLPATRLGIRVFILDPDSMKKKDPVCIPMKRRPGRAAAWYGNYAGLKSLL